MRLLAPALLITLTACTMTPAPNTPGDRSCSNDGLDAFAAQPATSELGARMLATSGAKRLRWVTPGMMVTMEYDPERLTVQVDGNGRVVSARCG